MKQGIKVTLIFILSTIVLTGCFGSNSNNSGSNNSKGDLIKVGWIGPLTGNSAAWGTCESETVKMFFNELNNNGGLLGKKVEVITYDTRGNEKEAVNAVKKLTMEDKVIGIIGPNSSEQAISISSVLESEKVPNIATVATNSKVTMNDDGTVKPYNFRVCFTDSYQSEVAAQYVINGLKVKNAAVLYNLDDEYSVASANYFKDNFLKSGGKIVSDESFKSEERDFKEQLTNIKNSKADVIFMPFSNNVVGLVTKMARDLGISSTFIGTDTWPSEQLITLAKENVNGSYFVNHINYEDPKVIELKNKYINKFNKEPEIDAYLSWDACTMFVEAVKKAGDFNGEKIVNALEETNIEGITGNIAVNKNTHNPENKDAFITQIKDGKYEFVETYKTEK